MEQATAPAFSASQLRASNKVLHFLAPVSKEQPRWTHSDASVELRLLLLQAAHFRLRSNSKATRALACTSEREGRMDESHVATCHLKQEVSACSSQEATYLQCLVACGK